LLPTIGDGLDAVVAALGDERLHRVIAGDYQE
jgi:hypothetical protein